MKITAILGSPHGMGGTTAMVLKAVMEGAAAAGAEVQTLLTNDHVVGPCIGCDVCHRDGECPFEDGYQPLLQAVMESDAIVLASPNYIMSVSAQLKAFFDRCCGPIHLMAFGGKYAAAVVTSGGGPCEEVEDYILRFAAMAGCWTVGSVGADAATLFDAAKAPAVMDEARALGERLVEAVKTGEGMPGQAEGLGAGAEFMRGLCTAMAERWPYEYKVWQARSAE